MATFAGLQSELSDLLRSLIELEDDAVDAYAVVVGKIGSLERHATLEGFRSDHLRHVEGLCRELRESGHEPSEGSESRSVLTQGKVVLGTITGDKALLRAMRSNERDINRAHERALERRDLSAALARLLGEHLAEERRHLSWIEGELTSLEELDEDQRISPRELPR